MNKKETNTSWWRIILISLGISIICILAAFLAMKDGFFVLENNTKNNNPDSPENKASSKMAYARLLNYIEKGWIKTIDFYENGQIAIVEASSSELSDRPQRLRVEIPAGSTSLIGKLKEANVDINAHPPKLDIFKTISDTLGSLIVPGLVVAVFYLFLERANNNNNNSNGSPFGPGGGPNQNMRGLGEIKKEIQKEPDTGITFKDIAGIEEVKEEFEEIVTFLKDPSRFTAVGATIPKGVLLVGPPGTGKTLLAKAIAGEAKVPFINISGSEFVEMFVGVGAARVRNLFEKAKQDTPCIIFIDEIDAVGRQRGAGVGGGNDEREQTLNQLLTEMDGFEKNKGIVVIAATNRADILDNALLRPGRFDRQVTVNPPDRAGRVAILAVHARNKKLSPAISLETIAQRTTGFGGAELANLLNEAAIISAREEKAEIGSKEISLAIERVIAGLEGPSIADNKNKRLVAYHEAGHAMVGTLLRNHDNVQNVTLVPRGQARGLTWFMPNEDPSLVTRGQIVARIVGALGGRAAEQSVFGSTEITTGASGDLAQVTDLAKQMILRFGMSGIGPVSLSKPGGSFLFVGRGVRPSNEYSEALAIKIDEQIRTITELCYNEAVEIMDLNRISLDLAVTGLIQDEVLTGVSFEKVVADFSKLPTNKIYESKFPKK
uniref:ATP-dependent zinc metalloprotease FtsH n=1 Tax=Heterosigma akashiwo TaxID=2829 RepID=A0A224AGT9_HETAK|nr:ATP-dependent Zn protease [Heterosigma akashiwo]BBA18955.1 ATP-dependent Zn protease [Heterosigma akashiwo]